MLLVENTSSMVNSEMILYEVDSVSSAQQQVPVQNHD